MKTQHENLGSDLTGQVIGAAIAVHREFGPELDEADYERALHLELLAMGSQNKVSVPLTLFKVWISTAKLPKTNKRWLQETLAALASGRKWAHRQG
jgi:hypothetical protein